VHSCTHTHTCEQFLNFHVGLGLDFVVYLFTFTCLCSVNLDYSISMLFAFVVLGLVSSVPSQEIGWEERLWNDLFGVELNVKPYPINCFYACSFTCWVHQSCLSCYLVITLPSFKFTLTATARCVWSIVYCQFLCINVKPMESDSTVIQLSHKISISSTSSFWHSYTMFVALVGAAAFTHAETHWCQLLFAYYYFSFSLTWP